MRTLGASAILALALAGLGEPALAHVADAAATGAAPPWTLEPSVVLPMVVSIGLFAIGWMRLRRRSHRGADRLQRRAMLFVGGWLVLGAAVVSPLHAAGERSFTAHMIEHELLMLVAAPLMVLAEPLAVMLWAFPARARQSLGSVSRASIVAQPWARLTQPVTATLIQAAALWIWHAPALFDQALANPGWHILQHLSFLVSALLFWSAMLHPRRKQYGVAALCLFATSVVSGALGALMAFSQSPWYQGYARLGMSPFGLDPLKDQQAAGLLMWIPGGLVHAAAALAMIAAALRVSQTERPYALQP
jgi:putative membrane protein